jgi:hypothetical protein
MPVGPQKQIVVEDDERWQMARLPWNEGVRHHHDGDFTGGGFESLARLRATLN